jgi:N-acetylmuramoyl-L-alanine amidase
MLPMPKPSTITLVSVVLAGLFVLAGCETSTSNTVRPTPLTVTHEERAETAQPETAVPGEQKSAVTNTVATPARENAVEAAPPPPAPQPAIAPVIGPGWINVRKWSDQSGVGKAVINRGSASICELHLGGGIVQVSAGNHFARWNEMLLGLGYPPRVGRDGLQMDSIDIEKNILPLAAPFYFDFGEKVLVLDPGHGGQDGGTHSAHTHQVEKNLTLDWALRVKRLLIGTGWTVILTRTNDVDLTLTQRVALADEVQPDLFVSLHFNAMNSASGSHAESGIETYCLTPAGLPSNITREFEDDPARIFPNNQFDSENLQWAVRFHHHLLAATGTHDRGVRRARFMGVIREQRRPAVLIEGGYLSSPNEARLLAEPSYRDKLAWAVAAAIAKH